MKRPRWNAGAANWRLHRAHTAKPLMNVHKFTTLAYVCSLEYRSIRLDLVLCHHHCLLARLSSSAECERRGGSHESGYQLV